MTDSSTVTLTGDFLTLTFPKIRDQIAELKRIPGARWNSTDRVWQVPVAHLAAVRAFAVRHNFTIDPTIARFAVPDPPTTGAVPHPTGAAVTFPYDAVKVRAIKSIPDAKFDPPTRAWLIPDAHLADAVAFARTFGLPVDPTLAATADADADQRAGLAAASRAHDADFALPALGGDRKSTRLNSSHVSESRMPSSA